MVNESEVKRVWVDTDITIGHKSGLFSYCDVDDGYALATLFKTPGVEVVGISSTLGNTEDITVSTTIARDFVSSYGPEQLSVFEGTDSILPSDLSKVKTNAGVENLVATLRQYRLTILAIGAVTNIAILLLKYPDIQKQIDEIVVVAGRRNLDQHFISGRWQPEPFRDLNFEADPRAFEVLLDHGVNLTLVPYEACSEMCIKPHDLVRMEKADGVAHYLAKHSFGWITEWEVVFGSNGFNPFDMVAAGYVINPGFFIYHTWGVKIETAPDDTARNKEKPYLLSNESIGGTPVVRYCTDVDPSCKKLLLDQICGEE